MHTKNMLSTKRQERAAQFPHSLKELISYFSFPASLEFFNINSVKMKLKHRNQHKKLPEHRIKQKCMVL